MATESVVISRICHAAAQKILILVNSTDECCQKQQELCVL